LATAAAVAAAVWGGLVALLAVATRAKHADAAPAGLEVGGDEPPAVVNLLTNGWKVRGEAVSATLVDLAARKVLAFEQTAPERYVVRLVGDPPTLRYERTVYDHVRDLAAGGVVPCEALTIGTESETQRFHRSFDKAVIADARDRGLSRPRWSPAIRLLVSAAAVVPATLAAAAVIALPDTSSSSSKDDNPILAYIGLAVLVWGALVGVFSWLRAERETAKGLEVAGRWLGLAENLHADPNFPTLPPTAVTVWDRYLAYGVALGVAAGTERAIPLGAESDTEAWSTIGGRWRVVRIRYPKRIPPGWGRAPGLQLFLGVLSAAIAGAVAFVAIPALLDAQADLAEKATENHETATLAISIAIGVLALGAALVAARGLWMAALGVLDVGRPRVVEGRVLRVRTKAKRTYVAVDDGTSDHVRAWVPAHSAHQGADVRATVATHVGFVRAVEIVRHDR
jgi:hypothetical protein